MVSKPTRGDNVLDLFPTSNQTLINKVEILSGISDHEISISNISVKPKMSQQKPRSVPLYRKTDWGSFRTYSKSSEILGSFQESTVEEIWNDLKTALDSGIQQFIPIKKLSSKRSLAWITQEIRRLMRKRDMLYHKQNRGSNKDRCHFKQVKHLVQRKIKTAHENYLADILGVGSGDGDENSGFSSKKF